MPFDNMTEEELIQYVWVSAPERTPLELALAERLQQALDCGEAGFGEHD